LKKRLKFLDLRPDGHSEFALAGGSRLDNNRCLLIDHLDSLLNTSLLRRLKPVVMPDSRVIGSRDRGNDEFGRVLRFVHVCAIAIKVLHNLSRVLASLTEVNGTTARSEKKDVIEHLKEHTGWLMDGSGQYSWFGSQFNCDSDTLSLLDPEATLTGCTNESIGDRAQFEQLDDILAVLHLLSMRNISRLTKLSRELKGFSDSREWLMNILLHGKTTRSSKSSVKRMTVESHGTFDAAFTLSLTDSVQKSSLTSPRSSHQGGELTWTGIGGNILKKLLFAIGYVHKGQVFNGTAGLLFKVLLAKCHAAGVGSGWDSLGVSTTLEDMTAGATLLTSSESKTNGCNDGVDGPHGNDNTKVSPEVGSVHVVCQSEVSRPRYIRATLDTTRQCAALIGKAVPKVRARYGESSYPTCAKWAMEERNQSIGRSLGERVEEEVDQGEEDSTTTLVRTSCSLGSHVESRTSNNSVDSVEHEESVESVTITPALKSLTYEAFEACSAR
ncbi:hypothetical protein KCU65_g416, partial [Aureobasidium melanogenum]